MLVTTLGEQEVSNSIAVAANSLVFFMFFIISYIREMMRENKSNIHYPFAFDSLSFFFI